ncbi:E3 binding domain-containing protein, partial [Mesorhizobium sp.]
APAKAEAPKADAPKAETPKPEAPKPEPAAPAPVGNGRANGERIFASPLARRIAREAGVDVSDVTGSGPHGRVVKA